MLNKPKGFTLIEMMVVVAIIGVLGALAYPSYVSHMEKTRRTDCQGVLINFALAMERFFAANGTYKGAAASGDTGTPAATTFLSQCPIDGATKFYNLSITAASDTGYTLRATPIGPQVGNGFIELDSTGVQSWDRDNSNSISASERTWDPH